MNSNNNTTQAYSGSPINQAENDFAPLQILDNGNDNVQHNLINNAGISNMNLNTLNININTIIFDLATSSTTCSTTIFRYCYKSTSTQPTFQMYSNTTSIGTISDSMQDTDYNGVLNQYFAKNCFIRFLSTIFLIHNVFSDFCYS
ncbi:hypothetical protein RhiirA5_425271 [Rhizophagus irregularis]|uniref:Uncharacterized protein n=1 Tax=Rhizophagus irregularis TaxID=588596 RepID=A0A2N0P6I2_9GLOM|nr:hypothetical protein RhiirA5_425271 [Rhizophagus irregularis]